MPLDARGVGTIEFRVMSVSLMPGYTSPGMPTPENPNPEPIVQPDKISAALSPVHDPASAAQANGSIVINTEDMTAFNIGDLYIATIAAEAPAATSTSSKKK